MTLHYKYRAYIPKHVNRDDIVKCLVDRSTEFISVETEQEAIELETASTKPFSVFDNGHFTIYNSFAGTVKCSYWSRNYITPVFRLAATSAWPALVAMQDGLVAHFQSPVLYFLPARSAYKVTDGSVVSNSVITFYDTIDTKQFAETTMKMAGCNQDFFVVARDSVFEFVLMENTGIKAEFMDHDANRYISRTIHDPTYIAWRMRRMQFVKDNIPKRLPNGQFKLKDHIGNEVLDGERFRLTVDIERYHAHYAGEHRNDEDPEYKGVDLSPGFLMMYPGDDSIFTSETIDGIVFLKYGEEYVYCPDDDGRVIKTSQELPEKNQRLQLEYDEGVLFLSRWDRFGYACEDWLDHRGYIRFENEDGDYSNDPRLELRLVKIQ